MLKYLRYTLAAIFLAASVGCLALWWRSIAYYDAASYEQIVLQSFDGQGQVEFMSRHKLWSTWRVDFQRKWLHEAEVATVATASEFRDMFASRDGFAVANGNLGPLALCAVAFPLWYPALVFALAAVGVLRLGQRFTIRSAIIATTVVAVLLGMVVAL